MAFYFLCLSLPQILRAPWTWHGIRQVNLCVVGTQHRAGNKAQMTQGHTRVTTKSKKYNTTQNTSRSHNRQQISHVPWESKRGREEGKERRKPRKYHRGVFMTDCTSAEEFPPRHCREVAQKTSEKREQGAFDYEGFQIFTARGNRWAWLSQKGSWALAQRWSPPSFQESPRSPCGTWLAGQKWTDAALLQSVGIVRDRTNMGNKNLAPAQLSSHPECQYL